MNIHMSLGIVDTQYSNRENLSGCPNRISYENNGNCYVGNNSVRSGAGFQAGDSVTVTINWEAATVSWQVDGQ